MHRSLLFGIGSLLFATATPARALVPTPVGGHPGEIDVSALVGFERGKFEPTSNPASFRRAEWHLFHLAVGYTDDLGPLRDSYVRLSGTFFDSPAEIAETPPPNPCPTINDAGQCEFHGADRGALLTPSIGTNFLHEPTHTFGAFLQGSVPIDVDLARFQLPRVDYLAGGLTAGLHITSWLALSNRLYFGSGTFDGQQNAGMVNQTLFHLDSPRFGSLPWRLGLAVGTYFEGDLTQRVDEGYQAAYGPDDYIDPIRTQRFALMATGYVSIGRNVAVEGGYIQKLFGNDVPATQFFFAGLRGAFSVVE